MRARDVVGRRIVAIKQGVQDLGGTRGRANMVGAFVLDDGTELYPVTIETETGEYAHEFRVQKVRRRKGS